MEDQARGALRYGRKPAPEAKGRFLFNSWAENIADKNFGPATIKSDVTIRLRVSIRSAKNFGSGVKYLEVE